MAMGGSALPFVFVAKSPCGDCDGGGIAGRRAGAVLAAGAVGVAAGAASSAMAADEGELLNFAATVRRIAIKTT